MSKLSINIKIENRNYPMRIESEDEEGLRFAGKLISDKIKMFRTIFNRSDSQDLLAMVAIESISENIKLKQKLNSDEGIISEKLKHLDTQLTDYLE